MNLYYVYPIKESIYHYVVLAKTKLDAENLFVEKTKQNADRLRTKRLTQGAFIVASTLIIDDIN